MTNHEAAGFEGLAGSGERSGAVAAPVANQAWPMGRDAQGRFLAGGPGRPVGARGRMSAQAGRWLLSDFGDHRDELLPRMRRWFLPQYLQLIGRMLPREVDVEDGDAAAAPVLDLGQLGVEELLELMDGARAALEQHVAAARAAARAEMAADGTAATDTQDAA
jgi:hypothetical protein